MRADSEIGRARGEEGTQSSEWRRKVGEDTTSLAEHLSAVQHRKHTPYAGPRCGFYCTRGAAASSADAAVAAVTSDVACCAAAAAYRKAPRRAQGRFRHERGSALLRRGGGLHRAELLEQALPPLDLGEADRLAETRLEMVAHVVVHAVGEAELDGARAPVHRAVEERRAAVGARLVVT